MPEHRLLTFAELRTRKGITFSRQHVNELIRRGIFPKSVKTPGGGHVNFWIEAEVDQCIDAMIQARDTAPPDQAMAGRVAKMLAGREAAKKNRKGTGTVTIARRKPAADPR
jgi:predicted DNA-binding transcriptional regulator AlpA